MERSWLSAWYGFLAGIAVSAIVHYVFRVFVFAG